MSRVLQRTVPLYHADPTVHSVVEELAAALRHAGIADPRRVSTDIVAALLEVPRSWPVMNREATMDRALAATAGDAARKLAGGAPFAYAVGRAAFRHLNLVVDERVLIPRPETELLVGEILGRVDARQGAHGEWGTALDLGTGSGAIALSLASEGRFARVVATDISRDALEVARANALRSAAGLRAEVEFRQGSLLSPVRGMKFSVIVSNPPYVAYSEMEALPRSVRDWEPPLALTSGHDGMRATADIIRDAHRYLDGGGILALEVDERRASTVAEMVMRHGAYAGVGVRLDLTGRERFVLASRI